MKKAFGKILAAVLFASALVLAGCSSDSDSGETGLSVKDTSGWSDLQDSDWSSGTWDYTYQTINNASDINDVDTYKVTGKVVIAGTDDSSEVIIKDLEGDTTEVSVSNRTTTFSRFVAAFNMVYDEDTLENLLSQIESYGITIKSKSIKAYKRINSQKDQVECFKSLIATGSYEGETHTLIVQVNESFVKQ